MAARLNRLWRLAGTALGFTLFGLGGLLLSLCWFPLLALCLRGERRRTLAQASIKQSFRLFMGLLRGLGVLDYRVSGLPDSLRGVLVVANHPSLLDYVMLAAELPACDCIVKQALWHNPFLGGVVRAAGYIPNVEAEQLLPRCIERVRQGGLLLVFPEGTRSTPLQPVRIQCSERFLTKQDKWYRTPANKPCFTLEFLPQIHAAEVVDGSQHGALAARQLTRFLTRVLQPGTP